VFGLNALIRPEAALRSVEFPVPAQPESRKLTASLMRIYGIRNVAVSYLLTLIWSTGSEKLMGAGLVAGLAMCCTDGVISKAQIGGGEWNHWSFAPVIAGIQAGLFGYLQGWGL
jgi:hypothetical protein